MKQPFSLMKLWLSICLLAVMLITLVSCSDTSSLQTPRRPIQLEFWTLQMLNFKPYIEDMIAEYEAAHPDVEIHWVDVPFSEGEKKAISSMMAKRAPDVINLNPNFSSVLAQRNALVDFNEYMTPEQKASYLPVTLQGSSLNNDLFGVPWYLTSAITIYNNKLLHTVGVKAPPQNYEAMADLAKRFQSSGKGYLLMPTLANGGQFFKILFQSGVSLYDPETKTFHFANETSTKALQFWVDLFNNGVIPKEALTEGHRAAVDRFQSGTLGLLLTGANFLKIIEENAPQLYKDTAVAAQFPADRTGVDFSQMILVVPTRCPHPKEATDFALFVTNPDNTAKLMELAPVLSPHRQVLQKVDEQEAKTASGDIQSQARRLSAQQLLEATQVLPLFPKQNQLNQIMDYYVQQALLGKLSAHDALEQAQRKMNHVVSD